MLKLTLDIVYNVVWKCTHRLLTIDTFFRVVQEPHGDPGNVPLVRASFSSNVVCPAVIVLFYRTGPVVGLNLRCCVKENSYYCQLPVRIAWGDKGMGVSDEQTHPVRNLGHQQKCLGILWIEFQIECSEQTWTTRLRKKTVLPSYLMSHTCNPGFKCGGNCNPWLWPWSLYYLDCSKMSWYDTPEWDILHSYNVSNVVADKIRKNKRKDIRKCWNSLHTIR